MSKLVLVRHGQSIWNLENKFTGWVDVDLSEQGILEANEAGILLSTHGFSFVAAYTSVLKRANHTLDIILSCIKQEIPIYKTWRLNERHYGALQGLNKDEVMQEYGSEQVKLWRRSYDVRPPLLSDQDPRYLEEKQLYPEYAPYAESLKDTEERVIPYWNLEILPKLRSGGDVLIVAHGNSLRGLIKHIDNISNEEIISLEIPTGSPIVYEFSENLKPIKHYFLKKS